MELVPRNEVFTPYFHSQSGIHDVTDDFNWRPTRRQFDFLRSRGFRCDSCGLRTVPTHEVPSGYLELHPVGSAFAVLCVLCKQSQHVGRKVRDNSALDHGRIVYLPQLSQGQVSNIAQYLGVAEKQEHPASPGLRAVVDAMAEEGARLAARYLSLPEHQFPDPLSASLFVEMTDAMSPSLATQQSRLFKDLRYLPLKDFGRQIRYWSQQSPDFSSLPSLDEILGTI